MGLTQRPTSAIEAKSPRLRNIDEADHETSNISQFTV
jgi:hypothetical protein